MRGEIIAMGKSMLIRVLCCVCALLLGGCVVPGSKYRSEPLAQAELAGVGRRSFVVEVTESPGFLYYAGSDQALATFGMLLGPLGGVLGAAVANDNAEERGAALAAAIGLRDPGKMLATRVATMLRGRYGFAQGQSGLVLSVETESWTLKQDRLYLTLSVRLGASAAMEPLASTWCRFRNVNDDDRPSEESLLADHGGVLKREIDNAISTCMQHVRGEMLAAVPDVAKDSALQESGDSRGLSEGH